MDGKEDIRDFQINEDLVNLFKEIWRIYKQSGGEKDKNSVDRHLNARYNTNKAAAKKIKIVFTASLRGEIYDWASTGSKRIKQIIVS